MKMRLGGVTGVAETSEDLSAMNLIAGFDRDGAGNKVRIACV